MSVCDVKCRRISRQTLSVDVLEFYDVMFSVL